MAAEAPVVDLVVATVEAASVASAVVILVVAVPVDVGRLNVLYFK